MKVHFIGIGGIGVSALAQYYMEKGGSVSGSDLVSSEITDFLKKKGARLLIGKHKAKNLPNDVNLVIYSPAVQKENPELKQALALQVTGYNLQVLSYPQALGNLTKKYFTIAVSGTHGKSTVTAMLSLILIKAGFDPTVILGTKLKEFGNSNFRMGKSAPHQSKHGTGQAYLVIEADEWQASFLNYWPKIIVLTNIEKEHLDFYKNLNHILRTYKKYISHLSKDGVLIVNGNDKNIQKIILSSQFSSPITRQAIYNFQSAESKRKLKKVLKIPGEHNISNAQACLKVAKILKIPDKISYQALSEYQGSWRRFEIIEAKLPTPNLNSKSYILISDYAHHPTEVAATLKAVKEKFTTQKIWLIFQPHQYQRTFYLFQDFVKTFKKAPVDKLIITDIYDVAGRENEKIKKKVNSKKLVKTVGISSVIYLAKDKIIDYLKNNLKGGEVVIFMGAGNIYKLSEELSTF